MAGTHGTAGLPFASIFSQMPGAHSLQVLTGLQQSSHYCLSTHVIFCAAGGVPGAPQIQPLRAHSPVALKAPPDGERCTEVCGTAAAARGHVGAHDPATKGQYSTFQVPLTSSAAPDVMPGCQSAADANDDDRFALAGKTLLGLQCIAWLAVDFRSSSLGAWHSSLTKQAKHLT